MKKIISDFDDFKRAFEKKELRIKSDASKESVSNINLMLDLLMSLCISIPDQYKFLADFFKADGKKKKELFDQNMQIIRETENKINNTISKILSPSDSKEEDNVLKVDYAYWIEPFNTLSRLIEEEDKKHIKLRGLKQEAARERLGKEIYNSHIEITSILIRNIGVIRSIILILKEELKKIEIEYLLGIQ